MTTSAYKRRIRRRRLALVFGSLAACVAGTLLVILLTQGASGFARFFMSPWLKARSGNKYNPISAFKRYFEKREEKAREE